MPPPRKLLNIRRRESAVVKNALDTPAGELLMAELEQRYVDIELYDADHAAMAHAVGRRDLIVELRRQLDEDPTHAE